jgi:hypothetical protein
MRAQLEMDDVGDEDAHSWLCTATLGPCSVTAGSYDASKAQRMALAQLEIEIYEFGQYMGGN